MKKIILFCLISIGSFAQSSLPPTWKRNVNADVILLDNTRKCGIGIDIPTEKLHVVGNVLVTGSLTSSNFNGTMTGTNTGDQTISLSGDITSTSGTGNLVTTIANNAVTNIKIANGTIDLTSKVTGILPVVNGGSGVTIATGTGSNVLSNSPVLVTPALGTPSSGVLTNATGLPLTSGITGILPVANGGTNVTTSTGTGSVVLSTSPALITPNIGTPSAGTLTNATGLPISTGVSGLATNMATFLGTSSSSNLASAVTDESGSGSLVFATSPILVTPQLGTPTSGVLTNETGLPLTTGVTGTLPVANGGTGVTTSTGSGNNVLSTSPTLVTPNIDAATGTSLVVNGTAGAGFLELDAQSSNPASGVASSVRLFSTSAGHIAWKKQIDGFVRSFISTLTADRNYTLPDATTNLLGSNIGISGGTTLVGDIAASGNLTLSTTSNATKGKILFGTSAYDEVNNYLGIGTASPTALLAFGTVTIPSNGIQMPSSVNLSTSGVALNGANFAPTFTINTSLNCSVIRAVPTYDFNFSGSASGNTVAAITAVNNNANIGGTNSNALTNYIGQLVRISKTGSYTGIISNCQMIQISAPTSFASGQITTSAGISITEQTVTGITSYTNLLVGTITIPSGIFSIYNSSTANNIHVGNTTIGSTTTPTAKLMIAAGTATASTAPLKFTAGTNMTTPESGAFEWDGTNAYLTNTAATRNTIAYTNSALTGTTTNDNAASGIVGEYISSLVAVGSAVSLTTATPANVANITLTAGDWDVSGIVNYSETTSTVTARTGGINSTSATVPTDGSEGYCGVQSTVTSEKNSITLPRKRISIASTTTIYLVGQATFSAGTCAGFGTINARRVR